MIVYDSLEETPFTPNTYITVGTFDGVHLGHRLIISRLVEKAKEDGARSLLITFDPHPQIVLPNPTKPRIKLLTSIKERLHLLKDTGLDAALVIPFTYEFSQNNPGDFVRALVKNIGMKRIILGEDHNFGKNRGGNYDTLLELSKELDFGVERVDGFMINGVRVSSTKIRHALEEHNLGEANKMLSYNYFVRGQVVHGRGMGSEIGYPTANIKPPDKYKLLPGYGAYLIRSEIEGVDYFGMANIGIRPTMTNDTAPTLEVYFFDMDEDTDLYGQTLHIIFLAFLREEKKFSSVDALINQIEHDERKCRQLIENL